MAKLMAGSHAQVLGSTLPSAIEQRSRMTCPSTRSRGRVYQSSKGLEFQVYFFAMVTSMGDVQVEGSCILSMLWAQNTLQQLFEFLLQIPWVLSRSFLGNDDRKGRPVILSFRISIGVYGLPVKGIVA